MVNLKSGRKTSFQRNYNVYVLDMMVEVSVNRFAAGDTQHVGFHRQGRWRAQSQERSVIHAHHV
eukprot:5346623-Heterocapsa_arctica.AAC.1